MSILIKTVPTERAFETHPDGVFHTPYRSLQAESLPQEDIEAAAGNAVKLDEKEVMIGPNNPTVLRCASPSADLPEVPLLNLQGGERDHARHGSNPWARGCRGLV